MNKRKRIFVVVLAVAVLGGFLWWRLCESAEPSYHGKPLSDWLESYFGGRGNAIGAWPNPETDEAVRQIGTNGIPTMLKMLRAPDSKWKHALFELNLKQDFVRMKLPLSWHSSYVPTITAAQGFVALGATASNAVPELIQIYHENRPQSQVCCVIALGAIGPAARQALPLLLGASTNFVTDNRREAAKALGNLHVEPELTVPALIKCLQDVDPEVRRAAVRALANYGPEAKAAVPALTQLTGEPWFMADVTNAVRAIDPDGGAKAVIK